MTTVKREANDVTFTEANDVTFTEADAEAYAEAFRDSKRLRRTIEERRGQIDVLYQKAESVIELKKKMQAVVDEEKQDPVLYELAQKKEEAASEWRKEISNVRSTIATLEEEIERLEERIADSNRKYTEEAQNRVNSYRQRTAELDAELRKQREQIATPILAEITPMEKKANEELQKCDELKKRFAQSNIRELVLDDVEFRRKHDGVPKLTLQYLKQALGEEKGKELYDGAKPVVIVVNVHDA